MGTSGELGENKIICKLGNDISCISTALLLLSSGLNGPLGNKPHNTSAFVGRFS